VSPADLRTVADHLWQSSFFAGTAGLLALALRKNRARLRHWLWLIASVKFLIPLSVLFALGGQLAWRTGPTNTPPGVSNVMQQVSQPFASPAVTAPLLPPVLPSQSRLPAALLASWACGFAAIAFSWWIRWLRILTTVRSASPLQLALPIPAKSSPAFPEPAVFGIFRPVLLLPEGIFERLTPTQLRAVITHELCHVRYRDNLTAAIHMFVETVFWFHPLVWWIGKVMVREREGACDEEVLQLGSEPQVYAEGILNVCKLYVESPLACAAGITGGELRKRVESIMMNRFTRELTLGKKILLTAAALAAFGVPIGIGVMTAQPSHAHSHVELAAPAGAAPAFEVASVKPSSPRAVGVRMRRNPELVDYGNVTLIDILADAYNVDNQLISGPPWLRVARYDVIAKLPKGVPASQVPAMLQALLLTRFKMKVHRETKVTEVYALAVGKGGPKLQRAEDDPAADPNDRHVVATYVKASGSASQPAGSFHLLDNLHYPDLGFKAVGVTMTKFAVLLKGYVQGLPVVDCTGLQARYNFTFKFDAGPEGRAAPDYIPPSLFIAIERLGLKLEARRVPVDRLLVDQAEKIPIEN
jgi:bla regulator protein BlaR1